MSANQDASAEYARRVLRVYEPGDHVMVLPALSQTRWYDGSEVRGYTVIKRIQGSSDYKLAEGYLSLEEAEENGWDVIYHASRLGPKEGECK